MKYASVCSGVGTCALAWGPLGWETAWFSEIEDFPCKVLAHHWPDVPNHGDMLSVLGYAIRRLRGESVDSYIDLDIDVLAGGTPCQSFSMAGKRLSMADARGNLSLAYCQLVHAIDALRPGGLGYSIWENVNGILTTDDNAFGCFLGGLAGHDGPLLPPGGVHKRRWRTKGERRVFSWPDAGVVAGPLRTVSWRVVDAQYWAVPQRRRRVIVVSCPAGSGFRSAEVLFEPPGMCGDTPSCRAPPEGAAGDVGRGTEGRGGVVAFGGNDKRGPIPVAAALNANNGCHNPGDFEAGTLLLQPVPVDLRNMTAGGAVTTPVLSGPKGEGPGVTPHVMEAAGASTRLLLQGQRRRRRPRVAAPPGHGARETRAGGQVAVCVTGDVTHALTSEGADASEDGTGRGPPLVAEAYRTNGKGEAMSQGDRTATLGTFTDLCEQVVRVGYVVRRLTPMECERLMGEPDDHTLVPVNGRGKLAADGPRYRAIGNSWVVPVFRWLGARIEAASRAV